MTAFPRSGEILVFPISLCVPSCPLWLKVLVSNVGNWAIAFDQEVERKTPKAKTQSQ
jgi:hypothetical protein